MKLSSQPFDKLRAGSQNPGARIQNGKIKIDSLFSPDTYLLRHGA
jgi:hypothetical protein